MAHKRKNEDSDIFHERGQRMKIFPVETSNRFEMLSGSEENPPTPSARNSKLISTESKKARISPEVLSRQPSRPDVVKVLEEHKFNDFRLKLCGIGTFVYPATAEDHKRLTELLRATFEEFFTYSLPSSRQYKVVLSGFDKDSTAEDIKQLLVEAKLAPNDIKPIRTRSRRDDLVYFLLYFTPGVVKFEDLVKVRHLGHTIVRWSRSQRQNGKRTQCRNC